MRRGLLVVVSSVGQGRVRSKGCGVKTCIKCGIDCSDRKRVKDAAGHYMCGTCFERERAGSASSPPVADPDDGPIGLAPLDGDTKPPRQCPRCGELVGETARLCVQCGTNLRIGQAPAPPERSVPRQCKSCGYDLRGLELECDCPECGTHNLPPRVSRATDQDRQELRSYYVRPIKAGAIGVAALCVIRLAAQQPFPVLMDGVSLVILVPLGLLAYFLYCTLWGGGFDQSWGLAAANLFAVMGISSAISVGARYIPIPVVPWLAAFAAYLILLKTYLDLDDYIEAFILVCCQIALIYAIAVVVAFVR